MSTTALGNFVSGSWQILKETFSHPYADSYLLETSQGYVALRPGVKLHGADLRNADLSGLDLTGADLTGADLTGANLVGTNLKEAVLAGAKIEPAQLAQAFR